MSKATEKYGLEIGDKIICLCKRTPYFGYKEIVTFCYDDGSEAPKFTKEDGSDSWYFGLADRAWAKVEMHEKPETIELNGKKWLKSDIDKAMEAAKELGQLKPVD